MRFEDQSDELTAYLEGALFTSTDESDPDGGGGEPLDKNYDVTDFTDASCRAAQKDLDKFMKSMDEMILVLQDWFEENGEEEEERDFGLTDIGYDFWLSRNGHGVGFADRPEKYGPELCEKLQEIARTFGEVHAWVTEQGTIELERG